MNPAHSKPASSAPQPSPVQVAEPVMVPVTETRQKSSRNVYEIVGYYSLLLTLILTPLIFFSSTAITSDLVKALIIAFGTIISVAALGISSWKEKRLVLPPKGVSIVAGLLIISLVVSSFMSTNVAKAFFGQGFETGSASFILLLLAAGFAAFNLVQRKVERAGVFMAALGALFIIFALFHIFRFTFGINFADFLGLQSLTSTFFGTWSSLGVFSALIMLIGVCAILFLPAKGKAHAAYWAVTIVALCMSLLVFVRWSLLVSAAILLGLTVYLYYRRGVAPAGPSWKGISFVPLLGFIILAVTVFYGQPVLNKVASSMKADYTELALSWQLTLDVASGAIKGAPTFGVGPNHFGQAFLAYKPAVINTTDLWGIEFGNGVGTIPTFLVTQGVTGIILWLALMTLLGILGWRILQRIPEDTFARFILMSSFVGTAFSWLVLLAYAPSHSFLLIAFTITGIMLGASVHYGKAQALVLTKHESTKVFPIVAGALVLVSLAWGVIYAKKTVALAYFASGVKHLTTEGNPDTADQSFARAAQIDRSDIYMQARVEAGLEKIRVLAGTLANSSGASSTAIAQSIGTTIEQSLEHARSAIAINKYNHYNYLSAGRVAEMALNFKIPNAYESAVQAYTAAIQYNPYNPSLYLNVARVEASQGQYDKALNAIGGALRVKPNYTDAAFMASQVAAAQGNLKDAIVAARVATQLGFNNPLTFFQLGILLYTDKDYSGAVEALENAVRLQSNYANARYFLGLSYARLGKTTEAITQFSTLTESNPDSQEVQLILSNLQSGRSPFADAQPPITPNPEKRPAPPLKEKAKKQ